MIKNWIRMKKNEWKVKGQIYGIIASVMNNQKDFLSFLQKLYTSLKDVPVEDMQKELIGKIAELVHEDNKGE